MAEPALFSLGPKGIITEPQELIRQLFIHAWLADASQSVCHKGLVMSIQKIAADYGNSPVEFTSALENQLKLYYGRYFPEGVTVEVTELNPGEQVKYTVRIDIVVTKNGLMYSMGESLYRDNTASITSLISNMP